MGGDKGEGDIFELFTPTSILPLQGGEGCLGRCQMLRVSAWSVYLCAYWLKIDFYNIAQGLISA